MVVLNNKEGSNLLSRGVAEKMGLVKHIQEIQRPANFKPEEKKQIFGAIGILNTEPVQICMKENTEPYCLTTARRVPFPLEQKVKEELEKIEKADIIEKVTEPTDCDRTDMTMRWKDNHAKMNQKRRYDERRGAQQLPDLPLGQTVLMKTDTEHRWSNPGTIVAAEPDQLTYLVPTYNKETADQTPLDGPSGQPTQQDRNERSVSKDIEFPPSAASRPVTRESKGYKVNIPARYREEEMSLRSSHRSSAKFAHTHTFVINKNT
ncbi:hypothetical protein RRG08_007256 [Elysia crispata]|uniref:Uncharacterized protein n=1 Tax=Elysia crispata TaxID=231223 RepID=A0AAE1DMI3_9GAST|nr:hypothetical protein RRG08_007256 [Elysia crispata]